MGIVSVRLHRSERFDFIYSSTGLYLRRRKASAAGDQDLRRYEHGCVSISLTLACGDVDAIRAIGRPRSIRNRRDTGVCGWRNQIIDVQVWHTPVEVARLAGHDVSYVGACPEPP